MKRKETHTKRQQELIDAHYELTQAIALQSIRIIEMQKVQLKQSDSLLNIEAELEKLEAEAKGSGLN